MTKAYASAYQPGRVCPATMVQGEVRAFEVDFNGALNGETITSAQWTQDAGSVMTLASLTQAAGVVSCRVTATLPGCVRMRCQATTSTGRVLDERFNVQVGGVCDVVPALTWTA